MSRKRPSPSNLLEPSINSPNGPSVPPGHPPLEQYLAWLWRNHGERIEFVVLFGSRARGDANEASDYDLLLGLEQEDDLRFVDRLGIYQDTETGRCEVFPYVPSELATMEADNNELLLEALADGRPLFDRGSWALLWKRFQLRLADARLKRIPRGWEFRPV